MRLDKIPSAVAITLVLLGALLPVTAAQGGPTLTIISPGEGQVVAARDAPITLQYQGANSTATSITGNITLDGIIVRNFAVALSSTPVTPPTNATSFSVRVNLTGFTSGAHTLGALGRTNTGETFSAAPVGIVVDLPPTISGTASFDHSRGELVAVVTVNDDRGVPDVYVNGQSVGGFTGTREVRTPYEPYHGENSARFQARDPVGQSAFHTARYVVVDHPAVFGDVTTHSLGNDTLRVSVAIFDPDGNVSGSASVAGGWGTLRERNGTYTAELPIRAGPGTHTGKIYTYDIRGGVSEKNFSLVLTAQERLLFEREVETYTGAHADVSTIQLPRVFNGTIEICIDACGPCPGACSTAPQGDPTPGQVQLCSREQPVASQNIVGWASWYAVQVADRGELFRPATRPANLSWPLPEAALFESPGVCHDPWSGPSSLGAFVQVGLRDAGTRQGLPACISARAGMMTCAFDASRPGPGPHWLDIDWAQGSHHHVRVRVIGNVVVL